MDVAVIVAAGAGVLAGPGIAFITRPWDEIPAWLASLVCATGFAAVAVRFDGERATAAAFCLLVVALVALTWIDLRTSRLPREISYPAAAVGAIALVVAALIDGATDRLAPAAVGAGAATLTLWVLYLVSRGGLGDGDVRVAPLLGMYLGFIELFLVVVALLVGAVLGSVVAIVILISGGNRKTTIPFGPFLAAGTMTAILL